LRARIPKVLAPIGAIFLAVGLLGTLTVFMDGSSKLAWNQQGRLYEGENATPDGFPAWYGPSGNEMVYQFATKGGKMRITIESYAPASIKATFDGKEIPHDVTLDTPFGVHELKLTYVPDQYDSSNLWMTTSGVEYTLNVKNAGMALDLLAYTLSLAAIGAVLLLYPRIASLVNSGRP